MKQILSLKQNQIKEVVLVEVKQETIDRIRNFKKYEQEVFSLGEKEEIDKILNRLLDYYSYSDC